MKPVLRVSLQPLIVVSSVVLVVALALLLIPGLSLLAVVTAPMSPYCSTWRSVRDASIKLDQQATAKDIAALSRRVRDDGALTLWDTPYGSWWVPAGNAEILPILLAQQERQIYGDAQAGVQASNIVLDAGAHVGTYVRTALHAGAKLVVAIEPSPDALEALRRNLAPEIQAGRVIVYPKGVWDSEDTLTFFDNGPGAAGDSFVVHGAPRRATSIPVTTIDHIVDELALERVDFIKADIKGATERMLRGGSGTIGRFHPRMALATDSPPEDPQAMAQWLGTLGNYQAAGGPCFYNEGEIRTDVMFFR